jgi:subtilisin family serine protease
VTAYVIDTGIRLNHADFGGRARTGYDAVDGGSADDCNGHGTHVAGTVGGATYGVAKGVSLVAVRVLNCAGSGTNAGVIAGIDWVTANHQAGQPAVANMSLGGGASTAVDSAVSRSISDGVSYAVAAGNGNVVGTPQNACNYSPARVTAALTVAATDRSDRPASFSNYGSCVDLFAPGVNITSDWYSGTTATKAISGTSMSTPHVTGVAALYLQGHPAAGPATVASAIKAATTKNKVPTTRTANNDLLFSNY